MTEDLTDVTDEKLGTRNQGGAIIISGTFLFKLSIFGVNLFLSGSLAIIVNADCRYSECLFLPVTSFPPYFSSSFSSGMLNRITLSILNRLLSDPFLFPATGRQLWHIFTDNPCSCWVATRLAWRSSDPAGRRSCDSPLHRSHH